MKKRANSTSEQQGAMPPARLQGQSIEEVLGLHLHTTGEKIKYGLYTSLPVGLGAEVLGAQGGGILFAVVAGVVVGYWSEEVEWLFNKVRKSTGGKDQSGRLTWLLLGKHRMRSPRPTLDDADEPDEETTGTVESEPVSAVEQDPLFTTAQASDTGGIARLTVEQIVRNTKPNSYLVWVGRSLTKEGNPAVQIKFYKQHFRFMGASQRGKSSMLAAFLDCITQTHDPEHVRLILLDKENQTSNLFAHLPHVLSMKRTDGSLAKLHARSVDEVVAYLIHTVAIMKHRYTLPKSRVLELPIILVYIEEFLAVKNELRARIAQAKLRGQKAVEQAQSDYATFVYCIEVLAQEGLKARVQLLLCAQVEYRDDDFVEALVNVQCGFSFCVRPKAAQAAGFQNGELLRRNAKENKVGQAVVETPDCNDLILSPEYDLEARLLAFEKAHPDIHHSPDEEDGERETDHLSTVNVNMVNAVNEPLRPVNAAVNGGEYSPAPENIHQSFTASYTQAEETRVLLAYAELLKNGQKITRSAIRDQAGLDNKEYQRIVKPVCDKHNIATGKEGA